jgi:hypothetical protein
MHLLAHMDHMTLNECDIMARTSYIQWNDGNIHFVLDQHA